MCFKTYIFVLSLATMINDKTIIYQLSNGIELSFKESLLNQYKKEILSKGYEDGWNDCLKTFKKSHMIMKQIIIEKKNKLLDELHDEISTKKLNGKNNI